MADRNSNVPDYSLSEAELIQRLLNPREGKSGIPALPTEIYEEDGKEYVNQQAYLDRVLATPEYSYLKKKVKSFKPAEEPGVGSLVWNGLKQTPRIIRDTFVVGSDVVASEMMGINENPSLDYISQDEYKKRTAAGEKPEDIWPHLTNSDNRTWGDLLMWSMSPVPGKIGLDFWNTNVDEEGNKTFGKVAKYDNPETFGPEASQRLEYRKKFYEKGGEVSQDGVWIDPDGKVSDVNKQWTPVEWNTREAYEKRKSETTDWDGGIVKQFKQNVMFEWFDPMVDKQMLYILEQRKNAFNDPAMQEIQKWSSEHDWKDAWSDGVLGKKIVNAVSQALPSYGVGIGMGALSFAITRNPGLAANISAIGMAGMDSSDMYLETLEWAKRNGYTDQQAEAMAAEYYTYYGVASMAWERLPFSRIFRRTKNLKQRKQIIKGTHDKFYKRALFNIKEELLNSGTVSRGKIHATFTQATAEALTELGQVTTQFALESDYKDETFAELFDVNAAIDAVVGGFGMGGATGLIGGKPIDSTEGIGLNAVTAPKKPTQQKTKVKTGGSASAATSQAAAPPTGPTRAVPTSSSEYIEQIVDQDINTTPLNPGLVNQIKNENIAESDLTKKIFKHQRAEFENYPVKKLADIVETEGWKALEDSNLTDEQKAEYKAKIAQELISQKKKPLQNKQSLTVDEQTELDKLDNIDIDSAINSIGEGKGIDSLIDKDIDKKIDESISKAAEAKIDEQIEAGTAGGIAITPEMKAKAEAEGKLEQIGEAPTDQSYTVKKQDDGKVAITKGGNTVYKESDKMDQEITGPLLNKKIKRVGAYKNKDVGFLQDLKNRTEAIINSGLISDKAKKIGEQRLKLIDKEIAKESAVKPDAIPEDQGIDLSKGIPKGAKVEKVETVTVGQEDVKKKDKVSDNPEDSNYYIQSEKSIVSKLSNAKLEKLIKEKEKVELENLGGEQIVETTDLKALEAEKARREEAKKAKAEKKIVENRIKQPKSIPLSLEADSELENILSEIDESDVNNIGRSSETLTTEESDAVKEEVKSKEEEIKESLCIKKGKGK